MRDLHELMTHIASVWKCDESRYPELAGMDTAQRTHFRVKHSILHITKTSGKLAALCEDYDHTGKTTPEESERMREASIKFFINALKLAEETGVSADDLLREAPRYVK